MSDILLLLRELTKGNNQVLRPVTSLESPYGYFYPEAHEIFGTNPGQEIDQLDYLTQLGYLDHQFFDRIHLCAFCSHFTLNFRELCPQCASANIEIVQMVHHFSCSYVAPEVEFRAGVRSICPKCRKPLRHLGVDYERPASAHLCLACKQIFAEPKVSCLCLKCGRAFGVEHAVTRTIYSYRLTARGSLAADKGTIEEVPGSGAFIDPHFDIYTFRFFTERLAQEVSGAQRYARPLSVILTSLDRVDAYEERYGTLAKAALIRSFAMLVGEALRACDLVALYRQDALALLLPDTPVQRAYTVGDRMARRIFELNPSQWEPKTTVSVGLAGLSGATARAEQILNEADDRLQEARQAGGNCVRPVIL